MPPLLLVISSLCTVSSLSWGQDDIDLSKLIFEGVSLTEIELAKEGDILPQPLGLLETTPNDTESGVLRTRSIDQYQQALTNLEVDEGPFAEGRIEFLESLGLLYQENGEHDAAIAAFQDAQHIIRINKGLFSLEQTTLVKSMAESYETQEKYKEMHDLQAYLFYVRQKNYLENDPQMLAFKEKWASLNIQSFLRNYNHPNSRPLFNNGRENLSASNYILISDRYDTYYIPRNQFPPRSNFATSSVNMRSLVEPRLRLARDLYESILTQNEGPIDSLVYVYEPQNIELHLALANIAYIVKTQMETMARYSSKAYSLELPFQSTNSSARVSREGDLKSKRFFEDLVIKLKQAPNPDPIAIARSLLNLADWNLIFGRSQSAINTYEEAYSLLIDSGKPIIEIKNIMLPKNILPIPTFAAHPFSREMQQISHDTPLDYKGYIDVRLSQNRYGKNGGVRILETSPNTPQKIRLALRDYLEDQRVRPQVIEGQVTKQKGLLQRYYYTY